MPRQVWHLRHELNSSRPREWVTLVNQLQKVPAGVNCVAWSPSGRRLATSSDDGIRLWDAGTGALAALLKARGMWDLT